MRAERMPRRASWAARIVPDAPPPTIATGTRSDFVVRPVLRICGARFAPHHMIVHAADRLPGGLRKDSWNNRMNETGEARSDETHADAESTDAVPRPAHAQRARMFQEKAVAHSRPLSVLLLRRHDPRPLAIHLATPTGFEPVALRLGI